MLLGALTQNARGPSISTLLPEEHGELQGHQLSFVWFSRWGVFYSSPQVLKKLNGGRLVFALKLPRSLCGRNALALFSLWASYLLSPCLSFLIYKDGTHLLHCYEDEMSGSM